MHMHSILPKPRNDDETIQFRGLIPTAVYNNNSSINLMEGCN